MKQALFLFILLLTWGAPCAPGPWADAAGGAVSADLPLPPASREAIERINASYYSLSAQQVLALQFTVTSSEKSWALQQLRSQGRRSLAEGLAQFRLTAVCLLSTDRVRLSAVNKSTLEDAAAVLEALLADTQQLLQNFWTVYRPYVTRLLDPDALRLQELLESGTLVTVRAQDRQTRARKKYVFDQRSQLRLIETVDQTGAVSRELPTFQESESPYLVTDIQRIGVASTEEYVIRYQSVAGLPVPAGFTFTGPGLTREVKLDFEAIRLRARKTLP